MNNAATWIKQRFQSLGSSSARRRSSLFSLVIVLLVLALLVFSLRKDWRTILEYPWQLHIANIAVMVVLHSLALGAMFLAWRFTMQRLSMNRSWRIDFRIFNLSMLARRIPIPIWYVGSRLYLYQEEKVSKAAVLVATTFEIVLIGLSGLIAFILLLPQYPYTQSIPWYLPFAAVIVIGTSLIARPGLLVEGINWFLRWRNHKPIQSSIARKDLLIWILLYLATWFLDGLGLYFTFRAFVPLNIPVGSLVEVATITSLIGMATMILPSGFGLKEVTMGALLSVWIPLSAGVIISIIFRLLQTIIELFWVLFSQKISS